MARNHNASMETFLNDMASRWETISTGEEHAGGYEVSFDTRKMAQDFRKAIRDMDDFETRRYTAETVTVVRLHSIDVELEKA